MANADEKKRTFILLRYVLIAAGAYLFLWSSTEPHPKMVVSLLIAFALCSNVVVATFPARRVLSLPGLLAVVLTDLIWISGGLLLTNDLGPDLLVLYLLVLFSAASGESLVLVTGTALLAGVAYLAVLGASSDGGPLLSASNLLRLPFLFAAALACGYLVDELKRARRQAEGVERMGQARAEALAAAIRKLQAPLRMMAVGLEGLKRSEGALTPRRVERGLNEVLGNLGHMSMLVDNYLEAARIKVGLTASTGKPVDAREVIGRTLARFVPFAELRGVQLVVDHNAALPRLGVDGRALEHILANLVHNAIKFSRRGGRVEVKAVCEDETVEITVADTGWGIAPEECHGLFLAESNIWSAAGSDGTRLGLYVVAHLAAAYGGSVHVQSKHRQGARFRVRLPAWRGEKVCPEQQDKGAGAAADGDTCLIPPDPEAAIDRTDEPAKPPDHGLSAETAPERSTSLAEPW